VEEIPRQPFLAQSVPNPTAAATSINFGLSGDESVDLGIYDARGRLVRRLVHGATPAGVHHTMWDGRDERGQMAGAGVYFCRLRLTGLRFERRIVRM
jgi:flagellar hook assembly protein FlgD